MFKLLITSTIAALSVFALPAAVNANEPACPDGYTAVESVGGPLCVNPIYLDGTWNQHPSECSHGYYQGSCAPAPVTPEPLPVEAYTYQMDTPTPAYVAEVEAKRTVWLGDIRLASGLHVR